MRASVLMVSLSNHEGSGALRIRAVCHGPVDPASRLASASHEDSRIRLIQRNPILLWRSYPFVTAVANT